MKRTEREIENSWQLRVWWASFPQKLRILASMELSLRDKRNVYTYFLVFAPVYLKASQIAVKGNHLATPRVNAIDESELGKRILGKRSDTSEASFTWCYVESTMHESSIAREDIISSPSRSVLFELYLRTEANCTEAKFILLTLNKMTFIYLLFRIPSTFRQMWYRAVVVRVSRRLSRGSRDRSCVQRLC